MRSLAAPLRDAAGTAIAAMNVSTHGGRTSLEELTAEFLPRLLETASNISQAISMR